MKQIYRLHRKHFFTLIASLLLLCGCCKSHEEEPPIEEPPTEAHRTILIYMLADNNLGYSYHFDTQNINDMVDAAADNGLKGGNLIIYRDGYDGLPQLIQIESKSSVPGKQVVIKEYPDRNSATTEVLREVIDETVELFPADEYGLILWSHSTGWVPYNSSIALAPAHRKGLPPTRSFGLDDKSYIELDQLANGIPDGLFHFILNDACFTAGIEYAYQLRNKARFIIGSAAEVMGAGMPYRETIPLLFEKNLNLTSVCQAIYNHYNNQSGPYRTATVSLVDCQELEGLAENVQTILANHSDEFIPETTTEIQHFDRSSPIICFDLQDYLLTFSTDTEASLLESALHRAVPYQAATPTILDLLTIDTHCGLTSYILETGKKNQAEEYYKTLDWYGRVYPQEL